MSKQYFQALEFAHSVNTSSAAEYWQGLLKALPHGHLLENPSGFPEDATTISVVHATDRFDDIKKSRSLLTAPGCLLSSVYTVPGYRTNETVTLHNYGLVVFRHKDPATALQRLVITITKPQPITLTGLSYLALGDYYYALITGEGADRYPNEISEAFVSLGSSIKTADAFIQASRARYRERRSFTNSLEAAAYINELCSYASSLPILTFAYFEAVSQSIMLLSEDEQTIGLAQKSEPHNFLYVELMHVLAAQQFTRFNAGLFSPTSDELIATIEQGIAGGQFKLDPEVLIVATANQLISLIGGQIGASTEALAGHSLYLWAYKQSGDIAHFLQQRTETIIQEYWKSAGIDLVYNSTTIKGEIGLTAQLSPAHYTVHLLKQTIDPQIYTLAEEVSLKIGEHAA